MEWHIITGSKGGVGKTLVTLLLLAYHLEEKTNEGILVLDLNTMNTDTAAMLLYGNTFFKSTMIQLKQTQRKITFQKAFSQNNEFAVGWTDNPFLVYGHNNFVDLLVGIKQEAKTIVEKLEIKPLQHVIIDTNSHLCNLFPSQDEYYDEYKRSCADDHFNIWFLWVYRQLKTLLEKDNQEKTVINQTFGAIERIFEQKIGPIIHTYTPVGLLPNDSEKGNFLSTWFGKKNSPSRDEDYVIDKLSQLETLEKVGDYIQLIPWITKLQNAKQNILHQGRINQDMPQFFSTMLYEAVQGELNDEHLPINIFPLSVYQPALEGYTDRERPDTVAKLRELDLYKNFRKLLNRKHGNF